MFVEPVHPGEGGKPWCSIEAVRDLDDTLTAARPLVPHIDRTSPDDSQMAFAHFGNISLSLVGPLLHTDSLSWRDGNEWPSPGQ